MGNKDITSVNKITTGSLDVNGQIDVKGNKIIGVGNGTANSDAVNKEQLDAVETQVKSEVATVNNQVTQNKNDITTINTNHSYYFTNQLKHNNRSFVKFPSGINSYPFTLGSDQFKFRILLDGHYHIIYTDFYKNSGQFKVHDITNGNDLFVMNLDKQSNWTPITINAIVPITIDNGFNHVDIQLKFGVFDDAIFDGAGYSTFYIRYLHP